jgi:hypothetical protein
VIFGVATQYTGPTAQISSNRQIDIVTGESLANRDFVLIAHGKPADPIDPKDFGLFHGDLRLRVGNRASNMTHHNVLLS